MRRGGARADANANADATAGNGSRGRGGRAIPRWRALTLIEILVVIVVLLGISALVVPNVRSTFDERSFESAAEQVVTHLLAARAHAQATRQPVEVVTRSSNDGLIVRRFVPGDEAEPIREGWATRSLPRGYRVGDETALDDDQPFARPAPAGADAREASDDDAAFVVFLPDGSTLRERPLWLGDGTGRRSRITVDTWTGLPTAERRDAGDESAEDVEDERDEDDRDEVDRDEEDDRPKVDPAAADEPDAWRDDLDDAIDEGSSPGTADRADEPPATRGEAP